MEQIKRQIRVATFNFQHGVPNVSYSRYRELSAKAKSFSEYDQPGRQAVLQELAQKLRELDLDVLLLQEVDAHMARSGMCAQAEDLARLLQMRAVYLPAARKSFITAQKQRFLRSARGQYGNAVLTRLPIVDAKCTTLTLPQQPDRFQRKLVETSGFRKLWNTLFGWEYRRGEARVCGYLQLLAPDGKPLNVASTHLSAERQTAKKQLSAALGGFARLSARGWDSSARWILGGDYNLTAQEVAAVVSQVEAPDSGQVQLFATGLTYPSHKPTKQIDFLHGSGLHSRSSRVEWLPVSDHRLLLAELTLN